jgi:hypothetical protein
LKGVGSHGLAPVESYFWVEPSTAGVALGTDSS